MSKRNYLLAAVLALVLSGCGSTPKNSGLVEAHASYNSVRSNPDVTNHAAIELKEADDTLDKADLALKKGESVASVDHLAYLAKQQVAIAQETAKRKAAELAVNNAATERDRVRLAARTAEAEEAKRKAAMAEEIVNQQATQLAAASVNAERDQQRFEATSAEAQAAKERAARAQEIADQKAAELAAVQASSQHDQSRFDVMTAEADAAKQQAAMAQEITEQKDAELAAVKAAAQRDKEIMAQQEMQLRELQAKKTERGMVITLSDVLFSSGKAQLQPGGLRNVQKLADFLKQYPQHKILVEGYTDSSGSSSLNQDLSERRANAVSAALVDRGISPDRIATRGYGEEFPMASNDTAASRQLNRRVEIILSNEEGEINTVIGSSEPEGMGLG